MLYFQLLNFREQDVIPQKVELKIDVDDDGDIDNVDDAEEDSTGAIVFENWDNDDDDADYKPDNTENTVSGEDDLVRIELDIEPSSLIIGTVRLESNNTKIKVWESATKDNMEIVLPARWDLSTTSVPTELFVEGFDQSDSQNDTTLTLCYTAPGGSTPICEDNVNITVVRLNLGVAVYRELALSDNEFLTWLFGIPGCVIPAYDHAGVIFRYNGNRTKISLENDANWNVIEMQANPPGGSGINGILTITLQDFKTPSSLSFNGSYTRKLEYEDDTIRNKLISTLRDLRFVINPDYPSGGIDSAVPQAVKFSDGDGNGEIDQLSDITALRCDGLPEVVYEHNDVAVWINTLEGGVNIFEFPDAHNNRPECIAEPLTELSPRAQYGGFFNGNTTFELIDIFEPDL